MKREDFNLEPKQLRGVTRRAVLRGGAAMAAGLALHLGGAKRLLAATRQTTTVKQPPLPKEYRYGHVLQEYYVHRAREIMRARAEARAAIRTPEQVMRLRDEVRRKLRACFGEWPERTPLNARVTGTVERADYTIEKLIYESRPNYLVTANVYVPKSRSGRMPAVVGACGHTTNGKAEAKYQEFSRNLARQGYVTLIYDPPSQGERFEYPDEPGEPPIQPGVQSHNVAGNQMTLVGRNFAFWEAWDGIRALDYLLSRPYVDASRVGVTGNSGGGTQTAYLNALDDRFTMAAPNCYVTRFLNNLENEEPADIEQNVPGILAAGLDMADYFVAQLPRPTHLGGELNDFFDVRGLRETYEELRRLYAIVGAERNVELHVGPETHGYNRGAREAMYAFFNRHARVDASPREPQREAEPDAVLQVTAGGQVHQLKSKRTFDFTRAEAGRLAARRKQLSGKALADELTRLLVLPARSGPPRYRVMRERVVERTPPQRPLKGYGFVIETEPRVFAMLHALPAKAPLFYFPAGEAATLYVPHRSSLEEIAAGQAPPPAADVRFALDVRGMGELTARTHKDQGDDFFHAYRSDYLYACEGMKLGESYCGRRVHDLLSTLDLFHAQGYRQVHLVGRGMGAITATFAAVLHPLVTQVTLHNALLSYHELTEEPRYDWPLSSLVFGILAKTDLPDALRELAASKRLTVVDPWDSRMRLWKKEKLGAHLAALGLDRLRVQWSEA
jgi:dienelactone hydrolase